MNQTFEIKRLLLLIQLHWAENKKRYGLAVVALMGLWTIWYTFVLITNEDSLYPLAPAIQQYTYFFTLFAVGAFYASQFFRDLGSKSRTANFLLVPASAFEKLICGILFAIPFFFIVFTATFYIVDALMVSVANLFHPAYRGENTEMVANVFKSYGIPDGAVYYLLLIFLVIQSWYLLGSVYFSKYSFVKTAIAQFSGMIILILLISFLNDSLMPPGDYAELNGRFGYRIIEGDVQDKVVQLPYWISQLLHVIVLYGAPPVFWLVTYLRLKEKEV
jgi:hypothetical protein